MRRFRKLLALCALLGAFILGTGAVGAFNQNLPQIPFAVQSYRFSAHVASVALFGYSDVTWLGADPTGTNDSSAAINEAWSLSSSQGGQIFLPPGIYKDYSDWSGCSGPAGAWRNVIGNNAHLIPQSASPAQSTIIYINNSGCSGGFNQTNVNIIGVFFDGRQNGTGSTPSLNYAIYNNGGTTSTVNDAFEFFTTNCQYWYYAQYTHDYNSTYSGCGSVTWSAGITNAVSNSGAIELTVSSTSGLTNLSPVSAVNVTGTVEANAAYIGKVVDSTHLILLGSTFTNAYVSGGTISSGSFAIASISTGNAFSANEIAIAESHFGANWGGLEVLGGGNMKVTHVQFQAHSGVGVFGGSDSSGTFVSGLNLDSDYFEGNNTDILLFGAQNTTITSPLLGGGISSNSLSIMDAFTYDTVVIGAAATGNNQVIFTDVGNLIYTPSLTWLNNQRPINVQTIRATMNSNPTNQANPPNVLIMSPNSAGQGVWTGNFHHEVSGAGSPNGAVLGNANDIYYRNSPTGISQSPCIKFGTDGTMTGWVNLAGSTCP